MKIQPLVTLEDLLGMYKNRKVGLEEIKKNGIKLPIFPNDDLVKIVAYLTFDGHLSIRQRCFLYTGPKIKALQNFARLIKKEFNLVGRVRKQGLGNFIGISYEYRVFNSIVTKILYLAGVPSGSKIKTKFDVPLWIKNSKEFSRTYLRVAFGCEGSVWKERHNRIRVGIDMSKSIDILNNGLDFIDSICVMLQKFNISTTKISIVDGNLRKDGIITKDLRFKISDKDVYLFDKKVGFSEESKNRKLKNYLGLKCNMGHFA